MPIAGANTKKSTKRLGEGIINSLNQDLSSSEFINPVAQKTTVGIKKAYMQRVYLIIFRQFINVSYSQTNYYNLRLLKLYGTFYIPKSFFCNFGEIVEVCHQVINFNAVIAEINSILNRSLGTITVCDYFRYFFIFLFLTIPKRLRYSI